MQKTFFFTHLLILLLVSTPKTHAQVQFVQSDWNSVLQKAQKENKNIFIDIFTTWCGPCHFMDKNVFTDSTVAAIYNEKFISLKADGEQEFGIQLRIKYGINTFPAYLYFNPQGQLIYKTGAGMQVESFLRETERALAGTPDKLQHYQKIITLETVIDKKQPGKKLQKAVDSLSAMPAQQHSVYFNYVLAKGFDKLGHAENAGIYAQKALSELRKLERKFVNNPYKPQKAPECLQMKMNEMANIIPNK